MYECTFLRTMPLAPAQAANMRPSILSAMNRRTLLPHPRVERPEDRCPALSKDQWPVLLVRVVLFQLLPFAVGSPLEPLVRLRHGLKSAERGRPVVVGLDLASFPGVVGSERTADIARVGLLG